MARMERGHNRIWWGEAIQEASKTIKEGQTQKTHHRGHRGNLLYALGLSILAAILI